MSTDNKDSIIPTTDQLKEEWGVKRYVEAVAAVSGWFKGHPVSSEQLKTLQEFGQDALDYFGSRTYHSSRDA